MKVAIQPRQVADFVVTGAEKNRRAVICSNMNRQEAPDQTGLVNRRLASQNPAEEGTGSTEIREGQRADFSIFSEVPLKA